MTVAPIAARAVAARAGSGAAARQGAGKVIDVTPTKSKPLGKTRPAAGRVGDAAAGAGLSNMLDGGQLGRAGRAAADAAVPASHARRVLLAEFTLCLAVLAFSPLTDKHKTETPAAFMKRASATMGVFFLLGLVSTGGRGASRAAAAFGALVTLVLLISQRSILTVLTARMGKGVGESDDYDQEGWQDTGEQLGGALNDIGEQLAEPPGPAPGVKPLPPLGPLGNGIR